MQLTTDKNLRKEMPIATGLLAYFPLACAAVSRVSYIGNKQHNPGQPMHWAREKSKDHEDCIGRHLTDFLMDANGADTDGLYHDQKLAWRALALCQIMEETRRNLSPTVLGGDVPYEIGQNLVDPPPTIDPAIIEQLDYEYEQARRIHNELQVEAAKLGKYDTPHKNIVYISGPMRKIPDHNFPAFDEAKQFFQELGYDEVISPADMDRADDPAVLYTQQYYADRDIAAINRSTHVAVLQGWEHSDGATAEVFYARWIGRKIVDAGTGGPVTKFNAAAIEDGMRRWLGVKA